MRSKLSHCINMTTSKAFTMEAKISGILWLPRQELTFISKKRSTSEAFYHCYYRQRHELIHPCSSYTKLIGGVSTW